MKAIKSVFGKAIISMMIVFSLIASSCNTQRSEEVRVKERKDGSGDVQVRERRSNDSVTYEREKTIKEDEDGYGRTKVREEKDVDEPNQERDRN